MHLVYKFSENWRYDKGLFIIHANTTHNSFFVTYLEESKSLQDDMEEVLSSYVPGLKRQQILNFAGSFIVLLTGDRGTHVTLRGFPQGLVTCNIEYYKEDEEQPLLVFEVIHVAIHF